MLLKLALQIKKLQMRPHPFVTPHHHRPPHPHRHHRPLSSPIVTTDPPLATHRHHQLNSIHLSGQKYAFSRIRKKRVTDGGPTDGPTDGPTLL